MQSHTCRRFLSACVRTEQLNASTPQNHKPGSALPISPLLPSSHDLFNLIRVTRQQVARNPPVRFRVTMCTTQETRRTKLPGWRIHAGGFCRHVCEQSNSKQPPRRTTNRVLRYLFPLCFPPAMIFSISSGSRGRRRVINSFPSSVIRIISSIRTPNPSSGI